MKREQDLSGEEEVWVAAAEFLDKYPISGGDIAINFFRTNGWAVEASNRRRGEGMTFTENADNDNPRQVIVSGTTFAVTKSGEVGHVAWVRAGRKDEDEAGLREIYQRLETQTVEIIFDKVAEVRGDLVFEETMQRGDYYVKSTLTVNPDPNAEVQIGRRFGKFSSVPVV